MRVRLTSDAIPWDSVYDKGEVLAVVHNSKGEPFYVIEFDGDLEPETWAGKYVRVVTDS